MIELVRNENGAWYYRVKGRNGACLCKSEAYSSRSKARRGARRLIATVLLRSYWPIKVAE